MTDLVVAMQFETCGWRQPEHPHSRCGLPKGHLGWPKRGHAGVRIVPIRPGYRFADCESCVDVHEAVPLLQRAPQGPIQPAQAAPGDVGAPETADTAPASS